jgi:phosphatidate cytidylyltransferase
VRPFALLAAAASAGLVLLATARPEASVLGTGLLLAMTALTLGLVGLSVWTRWPDGRPLAAVGATLVSVLYIGLPLSFAPLLRDLPRQLGAVAAPGLGWHASLFLALPLAITWVGDSTAYFAGRALGRRPLAPHASPAKTIEGALAGLLGSMAAALIFTSMMPEAWGEVRVPARTALWIGALVGVAGQIGDLAESVLKREAGVKDSGGLLPGHGGILDRLDSLVFAIPMTWVALVLAGFGVLR